MWAHRLVLFQLFILFRLFRLFQLSLVIMATTERPEEPATLDIRQIFFDQVRRANDAGELTRVLASLDNSRPTLFRIDERDVYNIAIARTFEPEILQLLLWYSTINQDVQVSVPVPSVWVICCFPKDEAPTKMPLELNPPTKFLPRRPEMRISISQPRPILDCEHDNHRVLKSPDDINELVS
jgi:hypothetical protein